jgi:hypothetical protein
VLFGHVPDRGGARVALVCLMIEAAGLALIWLSPGRVWAAVGAALTGFGYSPVYPGLGDRRCLVPLFNVDEQIWISLIGSAGVGTVR